MWKKAWVVCVTFLLAGGSHDKGAVPFPMKAQASRAPVDIAQGFPLPGRDVPRSVWIRPEVSPLATGNSLPLEARALDASGWAVHPAGFVWRSSDPAIAVVDGEGRVTARSPGVAVITASVGEAVGGAVVEVVPPDWPNEPAGYREVTANPWDELSNEEWHHVDRASESRIVIDPTAPFSQPRVLEHLYPLGFTSHGSEPAVNYHNLRGLEGVFIGFWWKTSAPWQGHQSGVNKLLYLWGASHRGALVMSMRGPTGGPYHIELVGSSQPDPRTEYLFQNVRTAPVVPGQWHRIELHVARSADGTGTIRWWQDGHLLGEHAGFQLRPEGWGQLELAPTWGGMGGPSKRQADYFRYDHIHVSAPAPRSPGPAP